MNRLYFKFSDKLGKRKIDEVVEIFYRIKEIVFLDGNVDDLIESYCYGLVEMVSIDDRIRSLREEKMKIFNSIEGIKNRGIDKLRYNGELERWLMKLDDKELSELNNLVDIKKEYYDVDKKKFILKKSNSNKKVF